MAVFPEYPIRTARLLLRPLTVSDLDDLLAYRGRPDVSRYVPFHPMTTAVVIKLLADDFARQGIAEEGDALTLGAQLPDGPVIGDAVLFYRSREHSAGEIGYVFHPDYAGHGYATETAAAILGLAFEQLGLHRVIARLDARNGASARLAARLGMRQEAHLVQNEWLKGDWSDELIFAMLEQEWPDSAAERRWRRG